MPRLFLAALALPVWLLTGCVTNLAPKSPPLRVSTGDSGAALEPHHRICAAFEAEHPGLRVQVEPVSGGDYYTRLLTQLASGQPPDVVHLGDDSLGSFVGRGCLMPLEPKNQSEFLPAVLAPGVAPADGRTYLWPKDFTPLACYLNARLFREAGIALPTPDWSWEDLVQLGRRFRDAGHVGVLVPGPRSSFLEYLAAIEGGGFLEFRGAAPELAVARLQQLYREGITPLPNELGTFDAGNQDFQQGRAAIRISGRWPLPQLRRNSRGELAVWLPLQGWGRANMVYWAGLGIPRQCRRPAEALSYLQLATSQRGYREWGQWGLPALREVAALQAQDPFEKVFLDEMTRVVPRAFQSDSSWGELGGPALQRLHEAAVLFPEKPAAELLEQQRRRLEHEKRLRR